MQKWYERIDDVVVFVVGVGLVGLAAFIAIDAAKHSHDWGMWRIVAFVLPLAAGLALIAPRALLRLVAAAKEFKLPK